jgi:hypothetical protein
MPVRHLRSSIGLRPGFLARRGFGGGNSGEMIAQSASSTSGLAMAGPPCLTGGYNQDRSQIKPFC